MAEAFLPDIPLNQQTIHHLHWKDLAQVTAKLPHQELIRQAYQLAAKIHAPDRRLSGDPWISHSLFVAWFLAHLDFGPETIAAALLHDVLETKRITAAAIEHQFGPEVARLVRGVTEIRQPTRGNLAIDDPLVLENMRRLILASLDDIRILLIRLVEKLHAALTIDTIPRQDQERQAEKFHRLYAPLAEYIGFYFIKRELEDIAFRIRRPREYQKLFRYFQQRQLLDRRLIKDLAAEVRWLLTANQIPFAKVYGRRKGLYSTYLKIRRYQQEGRSQKFDPRVVSDLLGLTILAQDEASCYASLGVLQASFPAYNNELDDYIAQPKVSGYRAIHLPIQIKDQKVEIQIKTPAMHAYNEFGPASHILYKLSQTTGKTFTDIGWVKDLVRWQDGHYQLRLFQDSVFVFTPKRDIIQLPRGATPLDFAARIHSDLLRYCQGAKINGKLSRLGQELQNGDVVEIIKSKQPRRLPRDWLGMAKTRAARKILRRGIE